MVLGLQVRVVGRNCRRVALRRGRGRQLDAQRGGHGRGNLVLHGEDIAQLAIEPLAPHVPAIDGRDQLRRDANALAGAPDAALEHVRHVERLGDARTSSSRPRNANDEVRAITFNPGTCASRLMISSANPSLKYSCSLSALRFANGSTATDGAAAAAWRL